MPQEMAQPVVLLHMCQCMLQEPSLVPALERSSQMDPTASWLGSQSWVCKTPGSVRDPGAGSSRTRNMSWDFCMPAHKQALTQTSQIEVSVVPCVREVR